MADIAQTRRNRKTGSQEIQRFRTTEDDLIRELFLADFQSQMTHPHPAIRVCESPIERVLAWSLMLNQTYLGGEAVFYARASKEQLQALMDRFGHPAHAAYVSAQAVVGQYRVDFLVAYSVATANAPLFLAVECDGHEFHEKTKRQARRDKRRDRDLAAMGVQTIRFAGSEIWADATSCANTIYDIISHTQDRHFEDRGIVPAGTLTSWRAQQ